MLTVFSVTKPGMVRTRLILPETYWSEVLMDRLYVRGYNLVSSHEDAYTCERDEAELARMRDLLSVMG